MTLRHRLGCPANAMWRIVANVAFVAVLCCAVEMASGQSTSQQDLRLAIRTDDELNTLIFVLCRNASDEDLEGLKTVSDRSLALAAAWEQTRQSLIEGHKRGVSSEKALRCFLGFVESRLGDVVPSHWAKAILSADVTSQELILFPRKDRIEPYRDVSLDSKVDGKAVSIRGKVSPRCAAIVHDGQSLAIQLNGRRTPLISQLIKHMSNKDQQLTILRTRCGVFAALHRNGFNPYDLVRVNRNEHNHSWSCKVWAAGNLLTLQGGGVYHWVTMVEKNNELLVFGVSPVSAYVEGFRISDAVCTLRFGTLYGWHVERESQEQE